MLLRCLELEDFENALAKVHSNIFWAHSNILILAQKLLKVDYYWPTVLDDVVRYAKPCKKCQLNGNLIHVP